ncbi:MAG TPA: GDP-mannose 4,6-dehydratase [Rhizobiaceae bacterium]|nr:GDP-mannose 4,6-dehydratase [Rhizobiaceae bacterium]
MDKSVLDISNYRDKKVLVTGSAGFIGSHLAEACASLGAQVTALVHYNSAGSWGMLDKVPASLRGKMNVVAGDIQDAEFVRTIVADQEVVFHLAALIAIPYSYIAPRSYVRTNIEGTLNVLEAARSAGTPRVVHTSTSEVYGTALERPIAETHPLQGQSPYSATKIAADKLVESYHRSFELPVITVRPFNTFGPRQSARAFIPTVISQALVGEVIKLGSLDPLRDMTFVTDTVHGFLRAGLVQGYDGQVVNLGTGATQSVGDIAKTILRLMGSDKPIVTDASRIRPGGSEVLELVSDNRKAADILGWSPQVSLEEGLLQTIEYVRGDIGSYRTDRYNV